MATATSPHTILSPPAAALPAAPQVEFVVPVYNEERDLAPSVVRLHAHLSENLPFTFLGRGHRGRPVGGRLSARHRRSGDEPRRFQRRDPYPTLAEFKA